jgi:hypothetical protein
MTELLLIGLAGFCASMVDGALGMGFGPTSSTILLSTGLSPAAVSTTVNLAKVATGFAAAVSHWRFENIDHKLVVRMALPGSAGAAIGVTILANVDGDDIKPVLAALLIAVGLRILVRFSVKFGATQPHDPDAGAPNFDVPGVTVAAAAGGVTNGLVGTWGPVVTPFLLHRRIPPRFAIGSANTAEVAVAIVASGSLLASLGGDGIKVSTVVAMLTGGVIASPIAAWVIKFLPARLLGLAVAALLLLTNVRELAGWQDVGTLRWAFYALVALAIAVAALRPRWATRRQQGLADGSGDSDGTVDGEPDAESVITARTPELDGVVPVD